MAVIVVAVIGIAAAVAAGFLLGWEMAHRSVLRQIERLRK